MTDTIIVLTEDTLASADVEQAARPARGRDVRVPRPRPGGHRPTSGLEHHRQPQPRASSRRRWHRALGKEPSPHEAKATAAEQLAGSIAAFVAAGREATGTVVDDDPLPALRAAVADGDVVEVAVVTYPHAVEDTFHRDWASRAREELQVPVLHLYSGTSELG